MDRQCGVINDKGLQCSRSLTCKSHAMGAKRSVEGRSKPYDELLLEWNRAHNPNFVEPVKRQTKEEKKAQKEKEKAEKAAAKAQSKAAAASEGGPKKKGGGVGGSGKKKGGKIEPRVEIAEPDEPTLLNPVQQDEEVDKLLNAVRVIRQQGWGAVPLASSDSPRLFFLHRRERTGSALELLKQALTGWNSASDRTQ